LAADLRPMPLAGRRFTADDGILKPSSTILVEEEDSPGVLGREGELDPADQVLAAEERHGLINDDASERSDGAPPALRRSRDGARLRQVIEPKRSQVVGLPSGEAPVGSRRDNLLPLEPDELVGVADPELEVLARDQPQVAVLEIPVRWCG